MYMIYCEGTAAPWLVRSPRNREVLVRVLIEDIKCHCVVFLGRTLNSHSASLHPGVEMGTAELNAGANHAMD